MVLLCISNNESPITSNQSQLGCKYSPTLYLLQEEPGGQRALIFDQGNRISQVRDDSSSES